MKSSIRLAAGLVAVSLTLVVVLAVRQAGIRHREKTPELTPRTPSVTASSATASKPVELNPSEQERAEAMRVRCVNSLKQLGLAVKVWALDNGDMMPPDLRSLTNVLSTPEILACPADIAHPAATGGWAAYSATNCSYEYLAPSTPDSLEPNRVLFRCPVHGNITLSDGSVRPGVGKDHPDWLVQREGKTYFRPPSE